MAFKDQSKKQKDGVFIENCDIAMLTHLAYMLDSGMEIDKDTRKAFAYQIKIMLDFATPLNKPVNQEMP